MSRGFHELRVAEAKSLVIGAKAACDQQASSAYLFLAARELDADLDRYELAAAKGQGCAGCDWYKAHRSECHRNAPRRGSGDWDRPWPVVSERDWCSEWRGSPNAEGATDER